MSNASVDDILDQRMSVALLWSCWPQSQWFSDRIHATPVLPDQKSPEEALIETLRTRLCAIINSSSSRIINVAEFDQQNHTVFGVLDKLNYPMFISGLLLYTQLGLCLCDTVHSNQKSQLASPSNSPICFAFVVNLEFKSF